MIFSELDMLTLLDLAENQLSQLPASFGFLVNLQTLNLRGATVPQLTFFRSVLLFFYITHR
jgi:hypothetical protein